MKIRMWHIVMLVALLFVTELRAETSLPDTVVLNELVVTGLKQSDNLQELPLSSTLVTKVDAERLNIVNIRGISSYVPNFYIPEYGSRMTSSIYVRGIGARMDQPVVGLNIDNLPVMNKDAYDLDVADIVRMEMLRGPQSILYGRNTMGGQINITTLSPLEWQGWRIAATAGNGFDAKASAGKYMLLASGMGLSATVEGAYSAGWFRNLYNGEKTDKEKMLGARLKYDWKISNAVRLQNTLSSNILRQGGYPYEYVPKAEIAYNDTCFYRRFLLNDALTVKWVADKFTLSSITSYQYIDDNMTLDQDFLPVSYFTLTQKKRESAVTQEVLMRGNADGRLYEWISGVFGFYKHLDMDAPVTFKSYGIEKLIEEHRNNANPDYPIAWDSRSFPLNSNFKIPTLGLAAYHQSTVNVGNWHLSAGLRLDYERVSMDYHSFCNTGYNIYECRPDGDRHLYNHIDVDIDENGHLSRHFLELLPKLTAMFDIAPLYGSNVYFNFSKGYKAGGYNTQMFSDILQQKLMGIMGVGANYDVNDVVGYKPEKSWNYEVGAHLEFPSARLQADVSLFYIDCRDQQLTMFPDGNTTGRMMTNAGKTRSFGGEVQLELTDIYNFTFRASYGYTNAKFREFNNGIDDFSGNYLPYAPQNTVFGQIVYNIESPGSWIDNIDIDVNARANGRIYWNESNTASQPLYALLGASVTFRHRDCSLQLWGENLTDTNYSTFYFVSIGNEFVQRGKPLRFGATLRINI